MCQSLNVLNRSKNGVLTFCNHTKLFQLLFNNLCFELYEWELDALKEYIGQLDLNYWESHLQHWAHHRKIPISVGKKHFIILVNREEVQELMGLLSFEEPGIAFLNFQDINYQFIEN